MKWLADHPRWIFHFTPTSASWLNAVEGFFSTITRQKIRRGVFKSVPQLEDEIARYIKEHNKSAQPFVWTKPAKAIFEKLADTPASSVFSQCTRMGRSACVLPSRLAPQIPGQQRIREKRRHSG